MTYADIQAKRGDYEIAPGLTMRKLYEIIHDRLEYCRLYSNEKLENHTDIDAICQNIVWVHVEKALGIFPNIPEHMRTNDG